MDIGRQPDSRGRGQTEPSASSIHHGHGIGFDGRYRLITDAAFTDATETEIFLIARHVLSFGSQHGRVKNLKYK